MRRSLAILLLALFGLAPCAPLLALATGTAKSVPMCCRRGGVHHCMENMAMQAGAAVQDAAGGLPKLAGPRVRCPFCPRVAAAVHGGSAWAARASVFAVAPSLHRCGAVQRRSRRGMLRGDVRQTRGPPRLALS